MEDGKPDSFTLIVYVFPEAFWMWLQFTLDIWLILKETPLASLFVPMVESGVEVFKWNRAAPLTDFILSSVLVSQGGPVCLWWTIFGTYLSITYFKTFEKVWATAEIWKRVTRWNLEQDYSRLISQERKHIHSATTWITAAAQNAQISSFDFKVRKS